MAQLFSLYQTLSNWAVALLCFPLGLIIGSFSSVLLHRVPKGESIVKPGSHCGLCHHPLAWKDLVPVVSYIWLRGRCRYCTWTVPAKYFWLEVAAGLFVGSGALWLGWYGAGAALSAWLAGVSFAGLRGRRKHLGAQAGGTLVEVLVALFILVTMLVPLLDSMVLTRSSTPFQRQVAIALAAGKLEELQADMMGRSIRSPLSNTPSGEDFVTVGVQDFYLQWFVTPLAGDEDAPGIRRVEIVVQSICVDPTDPFNYAPDFCRYQMPAVRVVGYLGKATI